MSQEIALSENKVPTIQELYENQEIALQQDQINYVLNQAPPQKWIKEHPFIKGHKYLPIDKVEFMLLRIFKKFKIEIMREGVAFNGVYVVVRVWYKDIITGEFDFHDGIGACQLQTAKGTSPADLININNGAISIAFPIAESLAIKDACDHFGNVFGANLNRKDVITFSVDDKLAFTVEEKRVKKLIETSTDLDALTELEQHLTENTKPLWQSKWIELSR